VALPESQMPPARPVPTSPPSEGRRVGWHSASRPALAIVALLAVTSVLVGAMAASGMFDSKAGASALRTPASHPSGTVLNVSNGSTNNSSSGALPPGYITGAGQIWTIPPGYYTEIGIFDLTNHSSWTVTGAFSATAGIGAYILTWEEYTTWGAPGHPPSSYTWSAGVNVTSATYNAVLSPGEYVFIWDNFSPSTPSTVDITSTVITSPSS
jgi:hypothetical protein